MPTTIDSLQIEIQSSSTNASRGIKDLAKSLGELKANGTVGVAVKNLNNLSSALRNFTDASNATRSVGKLVGALARLKEVGSVTSIGTSLTKLSTSLKSLDTVNVDNVAPQIQKIVDAVAPLSAVKAGGLNSMVNALLKIGKVTESLDDEKIEAFAERIEKLNEVLEPLSTKMTTIQAGLRGINTSARRAGSGVKQMGDEVDAASINLSSFIYTIQEVAQWIQVAVEKFAQFIGQAIEWDGIAARFGRGFGSQAQETYEWIQRLNEEMGINVQQFMQYSSIYATMLTGFGVAHEDATKMALGYTELTYDIWAGYNDVYKSFEEASEAVKSAIAGEVEPIRRAGFTIIESTLQQTAANHGLEISLATATEAQKSYLRYLTLVDQAHAQSLVGTYAKELNTAEGLVRTFSQQLKSLAQAFGSLFLPILVRVLPYLQAFVELLTEAVRWVAGVFGIEIQPVDFSGYEAGSTAVDQVADSATGATDALGSAAKAAKELKNATLGIDELNVISPPSNTGGSGGGGAGGGGGGGFSDLDIDSLWDESIFDGIQSQIDEIKGKFESWLPVLGTIAGALGGLSLASFIKNIGDALTEMNVLQKIAASVAILTVEAALVFTFADNYLESGNLLNLVGEALVTAAAGYLMFKAWGVGGAALALGVSIAAQLIALEMSLADGTVTLSSKETWIQGITTILTGALGGLILSKYTGFFPKEGLVIGMAVSASLVLATMRMGAIESGEIESGSLESWLLELGSVITAGLAGKFLGAAFYGAKGGPAGAMIGVTAGLALNLVTTIHAEGENFGDSISDWINVAITTAMTGLTAKKLWGIIGPTVKTALTGLLPLLGSALSTALTGLGAAVTAVGGGWVVALVTALVGVISLAIVDHDFTEIGRTIGEKIGSAFRAIGDWFVDIGTAIKDGFTAAIDWVKENFEVDSVWELLALIFNPKSWAEKLVPKMVEIGAEVLPGLWKGIEDGWNNFWGNIDEFIDGFIQGFKDGLGIASPSTVFAEIGGWLIEGLWTGVKDKVQWLYDKVSGWVKGIITKVKEFFGIASPSTVFAEIGGFLLEGLWSGVTGKVQWLQDKFSGWVTGIITKVKEFFGIASPSTVFAEIGGFLLEGLWSGVTGKVQWLQDKFSGWVTGIITKVKEFFGIASPSTVFKEMGGWLIEGLWNGINDKAKWLYDKISGWVDNVVDHVKDFFGIHSPSTLFAEIGGYLTDGLVEGMTDVSALADPLKKMWKGAKDWWKNKREDLSFTPEVGSIYEKLKDRWDNARNWWNDLKPKAKEYTPAIGSIYEKMRDRWTNARNWWNDLKPKVKEYTPSIGSIYERIKERWENARYWWDKKKGALSFTPSIGSIKDKLSSAWTSAKLWWKKNVKLSVPSLKFKVTYSEPDGKVAKSVMKALNLPGWPKLSFAANGGIFDQGSLIWAGERGPEVVANASGGKTGVMNVDQMQDAVFEGVYAAVMAANRASQGSGNGGQAVHVYLDGKQITATVEKRQRERGASIMGNQVYNYG